ncbi:MULTISPECIES: hypothetical protein [Providencia]|uniref:hypothetical protein n=1 Tax=Providencia TaxID=586 RepID=UPI00076B2047|nr:MULTISPECIES: hypothetical protein [Providencia]AMG66112.1 hypothetical protein AL507_05735 [Providencia stuartii]AVE43239.1 hypothetical protein AM353_16160 [Providencia stuartii]MBN5555631.1 hypothetical protein [Providencia stuartii]MBQ0455242.1 hypothetical protein [Providencia stuartii]MBQ0693892.1 hypothetical protein [Providencia stuartii]
MHLVKIKWVQKKDGGRSMPPSVGRYYAVSRFPEDINWQNNAWSVIFDIHSTKLENDEFISEGGVDFLMDNAPKERMEKHSTFDIYEGPKKVATVFLK